MTAMQNDEGALQLLTLGGQGMFLVCPAYLDTDGARRCGLPAEVETRYTMRSTDGPLDSAKIRCPRGHWFNGPIEFLTIQEEPGHGRRISQPAAPRSNDGRGTTGACPAASEEAMTPLAWACFCCTSGSCRPSSVAVTDSPRPWYPRRDPTALAGNQTPPPG